MKIVSKNQIEEVTKALLENKVVAFPTETVFGLAIVYDNLDAFNNLVALKKRSPDKPFSMMLSDVKELSSYGVLNENAKKIAHTFMPGEITILVNAKPLPTWVTLGTNVIGIRIPDDDFVRELIRKVGKPLLVTSANISGQKPLLNSDEVISTFKDDELLSICVEGKCVSTIPSTVVDVRDKIKVVRLGKISEEDILKITK